MVLEDAARQPEARAERGEESVDRELRVAGFAAIPEDAVLKAAVTIEHLDPEPAAARAVLRREHDRHGAGAGRGQGAVVAGAEAVDEQLGSRIEVEVGSRLNRQRAVGLDREGARDAVAAIGRRSGRAPCDGAVDVAGNIRARHGPRGGPGAARDDENPAEPSEQRTRRDDGSRHQRGPTALTRPRKNRGYRGHLRLRCGPW